MHKWTTLEDDFLSILDDLSVDAVEMKCVTEYFRPLNVCLALCGHFHYTLGDFSDSRNIGVSVVFGEY